LKPRALSKEELAKKKEREGNIAADLDRKRSLFAGASTSAKKPKPTETEKTHDTFTRMIPLRPLPLSASQKRQNRLPNNITSSNRPISHPIIRMTANNTYLLFFHTKKTL
jgi:hypothetical protein